MFWWSYAFILWTSLALSISPISQTGIANHEWILKLNTYQHLDGEPKRPLNSYMCYVKSYHSATKLCLYESSGTWPASDIIAKALGESWKKEDEAVQQYYREIAQDVLQNHQLLFPNHKFKKRILILEERCEEDAPHEVITREEWEALAQNKQS